MKRIQFKTEINATAEKVYKHMLGLETINSYQQWTAEFNPTSTYEGTWQKGSKMLFVGTDENGKRGGIISTIAENIPNKFVSIKHYGLVSEGAEITSGPDVEKWTGGFENYSFEEDNNKTTLTIDIDVTEEYMDYFNTTWPKALAKLKELVEQN
ncbi:MAG: SRPBCC domain-containing protein [Bacteroidia bacterium]|nr:SRPBCC domain-containing protein [Bacteroidia bacterium]